MRSVPPLRVRHQGLSLWQSVSAAGVLKKLKDKEVRTFTHPAVQNHVLIQGTNDFVSTAQDVGLEQAFANALKVSEKPFKGDRQGYATLAALCFQIAQLREAGRHLDADHQEVVVRKYSDKDWWGFFEHFVTDYTFYGLKYHGKKKYNPWQENGGQNYGVIDYKLPNTAKVAIIGDWGTGMPDACNLLRVLVEQHQPDAIIHLGDIYYAGTPKEVVDNYSAIFDRVFKGKKRVPIFSIPGNHDYYSFGYKYYEIVQGLNKEISGAVQKSSYFNLKTQDGGWQFLGMDTGLDDSDPVNQFNPTYAGPKLLNDEFAWHQNKLDDFDGNTILLSHHQPFSGNAAINGKLSVFRAIPYMNKYLIDLFRPYFGHKVAAWFWGHEHNQVLYKDGIFGLPKGRLVGNSAYEEAVSETPYKAVYPEVPFKPVELSNAQGYLNHGYAIIDFSVRTHPKDKVRIAYFEYPSWGENPPDPIPDTDKCLTHEYLETSPKIPGEAVKFNDQLRINLEASAFNLSAPYKSGSKHYARLELKPMLHQLQKAGDAASTEVIKEGDVLTISLKGSGSLCTKWDHHDVFYHTPDKHYHGDWIVKKAYPDGDTTIRKGDPLLFISAHYKGQYLCPSKGLFNKETSLTTHKKVPTHWFLY